MNKEELEQMEWEEPDEKEPIEEYEMFLRDLIDGRYEKPTNIEFEESDDDEYWQY